MFCWNCGRELPKGACFCGQCGAKVVTGENITHLPETAPPNTPPAILKTATLEATTTEAPATETEATPVEPAAPAAASDTPASETDSTEETAAAGSTEGSAAADGTVPPTEEASITETSEQTPQSPIGDLVIRRERVQLTDGKLQLKKKYYWKMDRRFIKKKELLEIPLTSITTSSILHSHCVVKAIASLLMFAIFTGGVVVSGGFGLSTWEQLKAPYRQSTMEKLESALARLEDGGAAESASIAEQLVTASTESSRLEAELVDYQTERTQELVQIVSASPSFDSSNVLALENFQKAYEQYMADLLNTFKNDDLLDSWLYPYYTYSLDHGQNPYISVDNHSDMWFYGLPGQDAKFTVDMGDHPETSLWGSYNYTLEEHYYYTGRFYITGSDFMNLVLGMPDYIANGAVFVKAFGGSPDPARMQVPGWDSYNYENFWINAHSTYYYDDPVWVRDYHLSAEDFDLDWTQLVDEQAYYDAYLKFMDTIAPGLGVYDMVTYYGNDDSYGGMCYDITGKEAPASEIAVLYLSDHPEALPELNLDVEDLATSYDDRITQTQARLQELAEQIHSLNMQQAELTAFLENGETLRDEYDVLTQEIQARNTNFTIHLCIFGGIAALLLIMAVISLCVFIRFAKKPRHLLVLGLSDRSTVAFSTARCQEKELDTLRQRISQNN